MISSNGNAISIPVGKAAQREGKRDALVILSGGQDSTTALFWALKEFDDVRAITFDYGQRHGDAEISAAIDIAEVAQVKHAIVELKGLDAAPSALTDHSAEIAINEANDLPTTFVPGRNIAFLTAAAAFGYSIGFPNLVIGTSAVDYSGYPDCRPETIEQMQLTLRLALGWDAVEIHAPLGKLSKIDTVLLADQLGNEGSLCWHALSLSHTCYRGEYPPCGECPACQIREQGFEDAERLDPLLERWAHEEVARERDASATKSLSVECTEKGSKPNGN